MRTLEVRLEWGEQQVVVGTLAEHFARDLGVPEATARQIRKLIADRVG